MLLSLSHPYLYFPSKTPKLPKSLLRTSLSQSTTTTTTTNETLPKSAIQRIAEKLRSLGYLESNPTSSSNRPQTGLGSAGEIFIPTPHELPKHRVGCTIDSSWSTPENPIPEPGSGTTITRFRELWRNEKERVKDKTSRANAVPMVAELTIPAEELKRLRSVGIRLEKRLKVGKAGITEGIVNGIHERWRRSELVKIKCEDLCRMNMKRTHEILERKTGGLVVWRSGSIIILYRGANYKYPYFSDGGQTNSNLDNISGEPSMDAGVSTEQEGNSLSKIAINPYAESPNTSSRSSLVIGVGSPKKVRLQLPGEVQLEEEADQLLDGLGPRFTDWWGYDPLPVDADLLPAIIPGFRKPFRLLPFGVKPKLTDQEMTILRRLSRPLPCHFALGKNRNLQGLAVSMIKLWEKCEVAKIAVKRGVQNTNSEIMVEELKRLTGGTVLSRDKEFIAFYRGKDFLPPAVSIAIKERRNSEIGKQKQSTHENSPMDTTAGSQSRVVRHASVDELQEATKEKRSLAIERRLKPANLVIKRVETKLSQALEKKEKAEKLLAELEKSVESPILESDREGISEEERYMLRKVGLRMRPFLLLGRRGVFAGTVENMHLHWKYRELVKIISKDRSIEHVQSAARTLEAESGGILVAVERVNKGHAIIIYRGKNYRRPADLRPKTLLNKKEAMKRSLEAQRCESLKLHVLSLSRNIDQLEHQMVKEYSAVDTMQLSECERSKTTDEMKGQRVHTARDNDSAESAYHQETIEGKDYSAANTMQLTECERSDTTDEMSDQSESTGRDNGSEESAFHQDNIEEVNEADPESLHSNKHGSVPSDTEETTNISNNAIKSTFPLNLVQDNWIALKQEDEFIKDEDVRPSSEPTNSTDISNNEAGCTSDEPEFHRETCLRQDQVSVSTTSNLSHFSDEEATDLSFGAAQSKPDTSVHEYKLKDESDLKIPFRAAPLSNRERLILRKQALKMRKRPVLAVGRNNVVTGVAKTIRTHFKKHPLAIVNIKGRAEGTSVQEVIFELEQATGAVLVSREPNKVILYRGWGEGETPGDDVEEKKDVRKGSRMGVNEEEGVSPMLMEAIRCECGLSTGQVE